MTATWPSEPIAGHTQPLVLLPVRIETRYTADHSALRVRVFPDDIHVDRLDQALTDPEQAAAMDYWTSLWSGATDDAAAFAQLGTRVGLRRAAWVAAAMTPSNLDERPDPPAAGPAPEFPLVVVDVPRFAPLARGLPERFVVAALAPGDRLVSVAVGAPVPDALPLDVAAMTSDTAVLSPNGLRVAANATWTVDYEAARAVGMGITLPLEDVDPELRTAALRIIVLGVRSGSGATALEQLLRGHRFTSELDVLAPGAPTNNTETNRTAWSSAHAPRQPPTRARAAIDADADGPRLAGALGIDAGVLDDAPGADGRAWALGVDARTALWPASWGAFLDTTLGVDMGGATISDEMRDELRDHYETRVCGGGPFRALRVGRQPYGVLPVLAPVAPTPLGAPRPTGVAAIAAVVARIRDRVGRVRAPQAANHFLEVLGTAPAALGLRFRIGLPNLEELLAPIVVDPFGFGATFTVPQEILDRDAIAHEFGLSFGRLGNVVFEPRTFPLRLPLVHDSDPDFVARLRTGAERTIESVLQAFLEVGREREQFEMQQATGSAEPPLELAREAGLELSSHPDALRDAADELLARGGGRQAGPSLLAELQPLFMPRGFDSLIAVADRDPDAARQTALRSAALEAWCRAGSRALRFDEAMGRLVAADIEQRRIAVAEALDTASHRLDAWVTSHADDRLTHLRAGGAPGMVLGAYGWVDELPGIGSRDERGPAPGGYIHAPSMAQASAAGVLRSANLAHDEAFAIDLSSKRVRTALGLLDGVRQGQSLGAVLGYRIERALHEVGGGLERFVLPLRTLAPAAAGLLTAESAAGAVATVLDGVALLELGRAAVREALARGAGMENPFGAVARPTPTELDAIVAVLDEAAKAYDAVADLVLADTVHALAGGAMGRAAAVLDGAAGEAPAPEPEFARTPTSGVPITHRDLLVLTAPPEAGAAWPSDTPRATTEPWLEGWAAARLGPPPAAATAAGLSALDVMYASGDDQPPLALPESTLAVADALRHLVTGARALEPPDLAPAGADPSRAIDEDDLARRVGGALDRLKDAVASLTHAETPAAMRTLAGYGVDLTGATESARTEAARRVAVAEGLVAGQPTHTPDWPGAASALFGEEFRILPRLVAPAAGDPFAQRLADPQPARAEIRRFLRDSATVRPGVARHAAALLLADAFGPSPVLRVIQLGAREGRWVALPFDAGHRPPTRPVTSFVFEVPADLDDSRPVAGLVLDEWTEVIPTRSTLTSGVAIHADAPNARPPQALLVALRPDESDWTVEALATTLSKTLDLARLRAVTLEHSAWLGQVVPALLTPVFSTRGEPVLDFHALSSEDHEPPIPFVKDA